MLNLYRRYLIASVIVALSLCAVQITGNTLLIFAVLATFMLLVLMGGAQGVTLPLLLFFLPWSPLLKPSPNSISFYTIGLVVTSVVSAVKSWRHFKKYHVVLGILLLLLTLLSKLIAGYGLTMDYLCFIMMIVFFPVFKSDEYEKKSLFYEAVLFFSLGIFIAALCAQQFASFSNIGKYIEIAAYNTIVRRSGFYGDPNFYVAQVLAALAGCLILVLYRQKRSQRLILGITIMALLYCGLLSGSKSFVLTTVLLVILWLMKLMHLRGQSGLKLIIMLCGILIVVFIATSSLFSDLLRVIETRLLAANDMDSFTTGRTELWASYLEKLLNDFKVLFIGEGYTNVKVNGRGSHNTILQMIYQLGLVGTPLLIGWMGYYLHTSQRQAFRDHNILNRAVLLTGCFLPWMAVDILFFDEFFLMQWFCILGLQDIEQATAVKRIEDNGQAMEKVRSVS